MKVRTCYRCHSPKHFARECPFKDRDCSFCGKRGHSKDACWSAESRRSDKRTEVNRFGKKNQKVKALSTEENLTSEDPVSEYSDDMILASIGRLGKRETEPYLVTMEVQGKQLEFEVDTGAAMTVCPIDVFRKLWPDAKLDKFESCLYTYTHERLPIAGKKSMLVKYRQFAQELPMVVINQKSLSVKPLLGRNWLCNISLDWKSICHVNVQREESVQKLLEKYPGVSSDGLGCAKTEAKLEIDNTVPPRFYKARPVPLAMKAAYEAEIDRQVKMGVLKPVKSADWAAPVVTVVKSDGKSVRLCGSYDLTVNKASRLEQYPLPKVDELLTTFSGGEKFSVIDLKEAYLQLPLAKESQKYTVINTTKGLFSTNRLVYGISSAPAIFQRYLETLLSGLPHVGVFLDDIGVTGKDDAEHMANLEEVFRRLEDEGLKINTNKCRWMADEIQYLGYCISKDGVRPTDQNLKAVLEAPEPENVAQVRSYLGMLNYYGKFIKNLSTIAAPMYRLLRGEVKWNWGKAEKDSFEATKRCLCKAPVLAHFDMDAPVVVSADASPYGVGAVLSIITEHGEQPVAYGSRSLSKAERNYSQLDREGLALVFAVTKFHSFLYGRSFVLETDHKPLLGLLGKEKPLPDAVSPRMIRWKVRLDGYQYKLVYKPGAQQANSDALSRLPLPDAHKPTPCGEVVNLLSTLEARLIKAETLRLLTARDPILSAVLFHTRRGWPKAVDLEFDLRVYQSKANELSVHDGCLFWGSRVVVPPQCRKEMLLLMHDGHPGICAMKKLARSYLWWPGIDSDIEDYVKACSLCQQLKPECPKVSMSSWSHPDNVWERIHLDYCGPVDGKMLLIAVDAYSKWPEVWITNGVSAEETIDKLRFGFASHGLPKVCVTDNAGCFAGSEFERFMKANGIKHLFSPPRHPASNGQAESVVKQCKLGLKKQRPAKLEVRLARWLFKYRNTPHSFTGQAPSEILLRRKPRTHLDLAVPSPHVSKPSTVAKPREIRSFKVGDPVYITEVVGSKYKWLPGVVTRIEGQCCQVNLNDGRSFRRHLDHIRYRFVVETGFNNSGNEIRGAMDTSLDIQNAQDGCLVQPTDFDTGNDSETLTASSPNLDRNEIPISTAVSSPDPGNATVTRSGRVSKPPRRLNL